ncbi:MAG: hypothetical protein ABI234_15580, partial [Ktedonobacteraceae bacterium]
MRQGDGSDFLDAGDPRSAEIGIVYVESMDSRQEVLNALYLLNGQGRKQIVLDLSNALKIFRQPVDFDGLKQTRRDLKAELIVIAPSGPGPAEFARLRRFPVYSSLASLKTFLTEAMSSAHTPRSQTGNPKKPGLLAFGSRKAHPGRVQPTTTTAPVPFPQQGRPVPPTPQQQGSPLSPLPPMAPTPQQQKGSPLPPMAPTPRLQQSEGQPSVPSPLVPPTPQLQEPPLSSLPPTPVDPRKAATFGHNQQVTRGPQNDDDLLYAPSAYQTGPSMPQTNQQSAQVPPAVPPQLSDVPATPVKKGRASKPIAGQPENRPIPGAIIFPGGSTTSRANPDAAQGIPTRASGTLRKNQNQPNIPAPQPPQNIPNPQQASGPVPVVPLYMPGSQQASGQVPAMPSPQPPKNIPGPPHQASGQVPSVPQNMPGPPQRGGTGKIAAVGAADFGANLASGSMPTVPRNMPSPPQRGGTGKIAAVDATGAVMAAGAAMGGPGNPGTPMRLVPPGPGAPPPGPRPTGLTPLPPPRASRVNRPGKGRLLLVGLLILLLLVLVGGVWASNTKGGISNILPGSHVTATVTLTPASRMEQNNYIITALPNGTTDNARRQVPAR